MKNVQNPGPSRVATKWLLRLALLTATCGLGLTMPGCSQSMQTIASSPQPPPAPLAATALLTMHAPLSGFNRLTVSITVCVPGSKTQCATVDNIMVDTGSTGLRLQDYALPAGFPLTTFNNADGIPLAECQRFGSKGSSSAAWGGLYQADVTIGSLTASSLPVQVVQNNLHAPRPGSCSPLSRPTSNGTLGIGIHLDDCDYGCTPRKPAKYYLCPPGVCNPTMVAIDPAHRLPNPVTRLGDGSLNGVVFDLPAAPDPGSTSVTGTLSFGVGTAANNQITGFDVLTLPGEGSLTGFFTTQYNGALYPRSYIDSGTATYVFYDGDQPRCSNASWAYCASPAQVRSAQLQDLSSTLHTADFNVGQYPFPSTGIGATDGAATYAADTTESFVWGAPFFAGKRVAVVLIDKPVPDGSSLSGPFYAWKENQP